MIIDSFSLMFLEFRIIHNIKLIGEKTKSINKMFNYKKIKKHRLMLYFYNMMKNAFT